MSSKAKRTVPRLRFREFLGCGDWEEKKLGEVCEIIDGLTYSPNDITDDTNGLKVLRSMNINNNRLLLDNLVTVTGHILKPEKYTSKNDILLCVRNGSKALIGKSALINMNLINYTHGAFMSLLRSDKNLFIIQLLKTRNYQSEVNKCLGATINQLTKKDIKCMCFIIPIENNEQTAIALFLQNLDARIEKQTQLVEKLKKLKKAYLQKLFPKQGENVPQMRFKEFLGAGYWDLKKLSDVCDVKTGSKDTQNKVEDGIYPFYVRSQTIEKIDTYSFDGEAILTAGDGVGVGKVFHYVIGKFDFHQRVYCLYNFQNTTGKFIFYVFTSKFYKHVILLSAKNSVDSIRRSMITDFKLLLPKIEEQTEIANFLQQLDNKIEKSQSILTLYQKEKKAYLQKMFV